MQNGDVALSYKLSEITSLVVEFISVPFEDHGSLVQFIWCHDDFSSGHSKVLSVVALQKIPLPLVRHWDWEELLNNGA